MKNQIINTRSTHTFLGGGGEIEGQEKKIYRENYRNRILFAVDNIFWDVGGGGKGLRL